MSGSAEIRWAKKVRPDKVRRLYSLDAQGIIDEELIDDAGYAMYARCLSIRAVTRAAAGLATCPRCEAEIEHAWQRDEPIECTCGWNATWGEYLRSYQGKQLHGGQAYPLFRDFIKRWPLARACGDKMRAIDRLIHACHGQFRGGMGRPAACNLIEGRMRELALFLDELAYGPKSTSGIMEQRFEWRAQLDRSSWLNVEPRRVNLDE